MLINWFTVIAQIINFLILVWLLKRYLYKPILNAIDEREKKITSKIEAAEKKEADAKKEKLEYKEKNEAFDKKKDDLMKKVIEESKTEKSRLIEEVRTDAFVLQKKLEANLKEDQEHLSDEITQKTKTEVFAIAKKTLKELADSDLEEQIVNVFIKRIQNTTKSEKEKFISAFKSSSEPIIIRSTIQLNKTKQSEIEKVIKEMVGNSEKIKFETTPKLISGIEMNANGYKVEWSISEYLVSVEKAVGELINKKKETIQSDTKTQKNADEQTK